MLTRLTIRNFKRFRQAAIELGSPVVFIGPNDSGKTTALQALALWDIGIRRWNEKRSGKPPASKRPGVAINRGDLIAVPVPAANLLWRDLHVRDIKKVAVEGKSKPKLNTANIRIDILVEGVSEGKEWKCGLEFDYTNDESFYCRPLRTGNGKRMEVPMEASSVRVAFLPPMSGLAPRERRLEPGAINVQLGEGNTAEVLRNLCFQILQGEDGEQKWQRTCKWISELFGVELEKPVYIPQRGEIALSYRNPSGIRLDLSSAGRGLQQTLLLLAHLVVNPQSVLLLDEPDAHLEILRQLQIYQLLVEAAREHGSQIVAASHSEVVLNEAADRDTVVAFVGKPHRIDDRGSQVLKSLKQIGFEQYYQAEQTGWVLYTEGSTDLAILRSFAEKLNHQAKNLFAKLFVHYVGNQPAKARDHFFGLQEAKPDLVGFALFDRISQQLRPHPDLKEYMWHRNEIENYLCSSEALLAYAEASAQEVAAGPLFISEESQKRKHAMQECIQDLVPRVALRDPSDRWWKETKASDDFLDRLFKVFYKKLGMPNLMNKTDYHVIARHVPVERIDPEVSTVLDLIVQTASRSHPTK